VIYHLQSRSLPNPGSRLIYSGRLVITKSKNAVRQDQTESEARPVEASSSRSLREAVYDYLRNEMNRGGLQPGAFLDLNDLAKRTGVSRTPLREALLHLETQGFVTVIPRRGFRLNPLSLEDIRNYFEIIGALESATMLTVGRGLSPEEIDRMRRLNRAMADAVAADDFATYYDLNLAFHEVYLGKSSNRLLLDLIRSLKQRLYDWPRREGFVKAWEEESIRVEHQQLIRFLEKGSVEEAAGYLQHVHWSFQLQEKYIRAYFFASQGSGPDRG
jgi:DNA-binding GntR family transcriptional regulator